MLNLNKCAYLCVRAYACVSCTCVYFCKWVSAQALFLCQHCLCLPVYVFIGMCVASLCFILPPGVQCSLAILKVRDDTMGEGSVIIAIPPSPPFSISPSVHLSFHVFSSLLCGSWYVDFIKFSSGWVTEKTGGDQESHPLFAAFICLYSFIPTKGLWS